MRFLLAQKVAMRTLPRKYQKKEFETIAGNVSLRSHIAARWHLDTIRCNIILP